MRSFNVALLVSVAGTAVAFTTSPASIRPFGAVSTGRASGSRLMNVMNFFEVEAKKSGAAASTTSSITEDEVRALFELWNDALATQDSRIVAKRYSKENPVLLPTVSDVPRTDFDSIKDYFDNFCARKPQGRIVDSYVKIGNNWAQDNGIYEFTFGDDGSKVKARYTFFYTCDDGEWRIQAHHSSAMPEKMTVGQDITEEEVKNLFQLWNDALATLDPDAVADRYASNAVLLPTVSDVPRDTRETIKDYFVDFLKLEPQGKILQSNVRIGTNWAQDAGIYEFTLGASGDKVKARYSYIYVFEDGQWKIAHHHSSKLPSLADAPKEDAFVPTKDEVRNLFNKWNDALATLDAEKVADCYAKDAILLPTVSDTPRTTRELIVDYFNDFLKKEPQGIITDGVILTGPNWGKDAGVYEFTMGADGSKVKARYSFVYVMEDGEMKIAHHHSSAMPEGLMAAASKIQQIQDALAA